MSARANGNTATRRDREERTQRATGGVAASLERIAGLHHDLAGAYRDLARDLDIQLADLGSQSDLSDVPTTTPGPDELLTAAQIATRLKVTEKTVRRWRSEGHLPEPIEIAGVLRWRAETFERWLKERGS